MYFILLASILFLPFTSFGVSAMFNPHTTDDQCFASLTCNVDPAAARAAINLIPAPPLNPQDDSSSSSSTTQQSQNAYRLPAIFEASPDAQIVVQLGKVRGFELTPQTLMTYVWPQAKSIASRVLEKCTKQNPGLSGASAPTLTWSGPPGRELQISILVMCRFPTEQLRGVTRYTLSGVQSGERLGAGRVIQRLGWGFRR